ncbi:alanine--tRNA ligase [Oligoflexus tunisiensis]|uniref:alanine--tRNA ligase n=1 Tax=Oligoflexus tunisiensis TaxID=708132 RepID=UPI000A6966A0|nr:alanine--tRNA ligase [Oligoflexus tunisiensis]
MKVAEIRSRFLKFFEKNGHAVVESSSLVPHNDPTLLFTNAGMVQFKDVFLGKDKRPYTRAASVQKCVRAGGKHNDLENVGYTARHHTFFEMLGNFSFGDYFKTDAIRFAWDFITQELQLPTDKLYVTVFREDDEAAKIWEKQIGVPKERIYRFDEKDNFWSMGETGPCGPCSEIFVDRGAAHGCGRPECAMGCDCDRFMEFWNLVFMQYNRDAEGNLHPLPKPSVDTGMGLERIASILQKTETNYEIDSFLEILQKIAGMVGQTYDPKAKDNFPYRVIADHARATTFLITDGVMPANEGRGYVLRRIIRRAIRYGKKIGLDKPFLHKVCGFVIEQMADAYPDIREKAAFISRAVQAEEEQFFKTLERGLALLDEEMAQAKASGKLSGDVAFKLYDTFGFPVDLTRVICQENGLTVDEAAFEKAMEKQKSQSRAHWKGAGEATVDHYYEDIAQELAERNVQIKFVGYDALQAHGRCLAILQRHGQEKTRLETAAMASPDVILEAVFDETPFYAESGGQAGDRGRVSGHGFEGEVIDVLKPAEGLVVVHIKPHKGMLTIGESYQQETDQQLRNLTARNHTATHMLHWALRKVLGTHVKQAGSLVTSDLLRFDFSHFQALTEAELTEIEGLINDRIFSEQEVRKDEMEKEEAVAAGAIAFFGEKYGDRVRVVRVGEFSTELCGGTHVDNTAEINLFVIAQESSIAAGVRRITAYTSQKAFEYLKSREQESRVVRNKLKAASLEDVTSKIDKLLQSERDLKKQIEKLRAQALAQQIDTILEESPMVQDTRVVTFLCPEDDQGVKTLRDLSDQILQKAPNTVVVLGMRQDSVNKAFLLVAKGKQVPTGFSSQELLQKLAPEINGRGGGKADMAQAGGDKLDGLKLALNKARDLAPAMFGKG